MGDLQKALNWYQLRIRVEWLNNSIAFRRSVLGDAPVTVSMTTHGPRLQTVHMAILSIAAGKIRPQRFILWLNGDPSSHHVTPQLARLRELGLEIRYAENFGPHTKYFPYVLQFASCGGPLVTADDDVLYSRNWLAGLMDAHGSDPTVIHCYLARRIEIADGKLLPYLNWKHVNSTEPSFRHFALGYGGVIYSEEFVLKLRDAGDAFMKMTPRNDDVWLHVMALRSGYKIRQMSEDPKHFPPVPATEQFALFHSNQLASGNDRQIRASYSKTDVALLMGSEGAQANSSESAVLNGS